MAELGVQETISLLQQSRELPQELRQRIRDSACSRYPNIFPISNWCAYDSQIAQGQASLFERIRRNIVEGNEVCMKNIGQQNDIGENAIFLQQVLASSFLNLAMTGLSFTSAQATIAGQRASLTRMQNKIDDMVAALGATSRSFQSRSLFSNGKLHFFALFSFSKRLICLFSKLN